MILDVSKIHDFEENYNSKKKKNVNFYLDEKLTSNELLEILDISKNMNCFSDLTEMIAFHPSAEKIVFDKIYAYSGKNSWNMNGIATSKKCPLRILKKLEKSSIKSISEHSKINILNRNLKYFNLFKIFKLLKKHNGDSFFDVGVRGIISRSNVTPVLVLNFLQEDDFDFIANQATKNKNERLMR